MSLTDLHRLSVTDAARLIRDGAISSLDLVEACLSRVRELDDRVEAWAFLDPDHARAQARAADEWRLSGQPTGSLHGVPVGLKDIIDTADMPTENGSVLHAGRTPSRDAAVVARLRAAGAVIMGKTVTTEFATAFPGKTRNPHSPEHTPGGSSSGSAAAVAAGMVPLALGSQTGGSIIGPAAFCGVYGFKPTHGLIPRTGMWALSRSLDHVGLFARSVEDLALLAEPLMGHDEGDPDTRRRLHARFYVETIRPFMNEGHSFPELSLAAWGAENERVHRIAETQETEYRAWGGVDYWLVGAYWDDRDPADQTERFLPEGLWENGYHDRYINDVFSMRVNDRIAIKTVSMQRKGLPFEARGQTVSG